jgi:hypothetical protein
MARATDDLQRRAVLLEMAGRWFDLAHAHDNHGGANQNEARQLKPRV